MSSERTKAADEIFCRHCGEAIKERAELCPHCGVRNEFQLDSQLVHLEDESRPDHQTDVSRYRTSPDTNTAAAVAYLVPLLSGVIVYSLSDDDFSQFHAAQSVAIFGLFTAASSIFAGTFVAIGGIALTVLNNLLSVVGLGIWLFLIATAYQGEKRRIPVAASLAEALMSWTSGRPSNPSASNEQANEESTPEIDPLTTLRERYARGEIGDTEFERRLDQLLDSERTVEDHDQRELEQFERSR
jgi:uncharacterized membrane protein